MVKIKRDNRKISHSLKNFFINISQLKSLPFPFPFSYSSKREDIQPSPSQWKTNSSPWKYEAMWRMSLSLFSLTRSLKYTSSLEMSSPIELSVRVALHEVSNTIRDWRPWVMRMECRCWTRDMTCDVGGGSVLQERPSISSRLKKKRCFVWRKFMREPFWDLRSPSYIELVKFKQNIKKIGINSFLTISLIVKP